MDVDADYATSLLQELVRIDSVNPDLEEDGAGEREIASFTAGAMQEFGLDVSLFEPEPGRTSVLGRLPGTGDGPSLMLNGHLDTVGVGGMTDPFSGEIREGRLYGRGAYDMKGGLAACLAAARALARADLELPGDLLVSAVSDEEAASLGTRHLLDEVVPDAAIVTEPTGLDVCVAHKGFAWHTVTTEGRAAHGSRPDLGADANLRMARFLAGLDELRRELAGREPHPLLGPPSLHVGILRGGTAPSVYADRCRASVEWRTLPGDEVDEATERLRELAAEVRRDGSGLECTVELDLERAPFETSADAPVVRALGSVIERRGVGSEVRGEG
ncbi:MAG: M20/M25/M40 family metallo-hydrolase, partial [Gemmatimonadota bacterium]